MDTKAMSRLPTDDEVEQLVAQARAEARDEVLARLRRRFVDELLLRVEHTLADPQQRRPGLSLLGVVPSESDLNGVRHGAVKALVTELDPAELDDPQTLERSVRSHTDTLLGALRAGPVVPTRFGTIFPQRDDLIAWLERNEQPLVEELARLRDSVEWGLKIAPREHAEAELVGAGAYLERRLAAGEEVARRSSALAARADLWHVRLSAQASDAARNPDRPFAAAYLVHASQQPDFDAAVLELQDELDDEFELSLTGPWPPFSFVPETLT